MTFDLSDQFESPSNVLRVGQGSYLSNLVVIAHSETNWPPHNLWSVGSLRNSRNKPQAVGPYPGAKYQLHMSKHGSWTNWPLNDLWPVGSLQIFQKCIAGWPRITLTKLGGHWSFLNILTSKWPLTCRVNLKVPAMYCGLAKDHTYQIWWS